MKTEENSPRPPCPDDFVEPSYCSLLFQTIFFSQLTVFSDSRRLLSQILDFGAARKQRECCIFATSGYMGLYTPQIPMELESQARLANAALLANWDYENHCFGHLWDFGHRDVCKSLECR